MKRFKLLIFALLTFIFIPGFVNAASGTISVTGGGTVIKGNKFNVTVTLSSATPMVSWQMDLSYDKNYLQLNSSTAEGGGTTMVNSSATGTKSKSYTFTFTAKQTGSTKVGVNSYMAISNVDMSQLSLTSSSKTINIKTQEEIEASYSPNAFLKSITVGEYTLDPVFNKNTKEYSVEVPNEVEKVTLSAAKEDVNATISGTGEKELVEGNNKFEIVCTAQKGNSLTYTVNIYRKELDPIKVKVDGKELTIVRKTDALGELQSFTPATVKYGEDDVPALKSEVTGYTLLGLKDEEGNVSYYLYEEGKVTDKYFEIKSNIYSVYPMELPNNSLFDDYKKRELTIDDEKVMSYSLSKKSKNVIIYGQNVETGDVLYYSYNIEDKSVQPFDKELLEFFNKKNDTYKYIIMGSLVLVVLLVFLLIIKKPKAKKQNRKDDFDKFVEMKSEDKVMDTFELEVEKENIEKEIEEEIEVEETIDDEIREEETKLTDEDIEEEVNEEVEEESLDEEDEEEEVSVEVEIDEEEETEDEEEVSEEVDEPSHDLDEVMNTDEAEEEKTPVKSEEEILEDLEKDDDFIEEELSKTKQMTRAERRRQRREERRALRDF